LFQYNTLMHVSTELPVHSVILLLRPKANSSDLTGEYVVDGADGKPISIFRYHVLRLWEESIDTLLSAGIGLAPLALLTNESDRDFAGAVSRVQERLRFGGVPANLESSLMNASFMLGCLRRDWDKIEELYRSVAMSIELEESTMYQMIHRRGEERGRTREAQETLLRLAGKQFGQPTPQIELSVRSVSDRPRLERMTDRLSLAADWDDLLATP
jgi:predicted transposase YdaD